MFDIYAPKTLWLLIEFHLPPNKPLEKTAFIAPTLVPISVIRKLHSITVHLYTMQVIFKLKEENKISHFSHKSFIYLLFIM